MLDGQRTAFNELKEVLDLTDGNLASHGCP
jgi:hypothetical protein